MEEIKKKHHFVLVHGVCHGAWCWYKVKTLLKASGHRVTAVDLAAAGIDVTKSITEILTCEEYSQPLIKFLDSLPNDEKVVLVGHSFGGLSVAIAMDKFPTKISGAIFAASFMPDTTNSPALVVDKYVSSLPKETWMDTESKPYGADNSAEAMLFSTQFMKFGLYQLSPPEDLELGLTLKRWGSLFVNDLSKRKSFSNEGYGSVPRAYIVCKEDKTVFLEHQKWMIENFPPKLVMELEETDHMPMFSNPKQFSDQIMEIADKFA